MRAPVLTWVLAQAPARAKIRYARRLSQVPDPTLEFVETQSGRRLEFVEM
jgi:hypothetical protein